MSGLSFFNTAYFFGFALLALPVLLHLLSRRRTKKINFSTVRFFDESVVRSSKARKLKRLLLLCARLLLLALLLCIFAKPYNPHGEFSWLNAPGGFVYCWIDPTKSMEYSEGGEPVWHKAVACADSLDKALPVSTRRFLFDQSLGGFTPKTAFHGADDFHTQCASPRLAEALAEFKTQRQSTRRMSTLVLISDFQENICAPLDSFFNVDSLSAPCFAVSVAPQKPWNFSLRCAVVTKEHPETVTGIAASVGKDFPKAGISVVMNGMRVCQEFVSVKKDGATRVSLPLPAQGEQAAGALTIDAVDPFQCDNIRYFLRNAPNSFRVIIIGDSSKSFSIACALRSADRQTWNPITMRRPEMVSFDDIDSSDVLILNELTIMPPALHALHGGLGISGKVVVVSPAIDPTGSAVTSQLLHLFNPRSVSIEVDGTKSRVPVFSDTMSLLWKGFSRFSESGCAVYRYIRPLPGSVLLNLDNHAPLATFSLDSMHCGWVFFASPVDITADNNFYLTGMYVPCLDAILRYSLESIRGETDEWIAGKSRRNPFLKFQSPVSVFDEHNNPVARWDGLRSVVVSDPGLYRIQTSGQKPVWAAVNLDSGETSLRFVRPKAADRGAAGFRYMSQTDFFSGLKNKNDFLHVYGFWCALALVMLAEMFFWERPRGNKIRS